MSAEGAALTRDALLDGRLVLLQPARGHRAGTDAILLAASAPAREGELVVDAGAGTGAAGLVAALGAPGARVALVERDPALAALAGANARANGLGARVFGLAADLLAGPALRPGCADLVLTNPPWFEAGEAPLSPDPRRAAAHAFSAGGLVAWIEACATLLRPRGRLALVQRADKLAACLAALAPRFGAVRITPVLPRAGRDAARVLLAATKGARGPLALGAPLVLHGPDGRFTPEAERAHREGRLG